MEQLTIQNPSMDLIDKLSTHIYGAVVFSDDNFSEILHWHGGASLLLNFGALDIREFSSFEGGQISKKSVFFISRPLIDNTLETLHDVINNSYFESVTIITNIHPAMQTLVRFKPPTDENVLETLVNLERKINSWIAVKINKTGMCKLLYVPLVASQIIPNLFTFPCHYNFFPLLPTDVNRLQVRHKLGSSKHSPIDFEHLPKNLQLKYKLLVSSLHTFSELLSITEQNIFSIGASSRIIGQELASLNWRKASKHSSSSSLRKSSLVLIDRTLDTSNAIQHQLDCTLEKILWGLPKLGTSLFSGGDDDNDAVGGGDDDFERDDVTGRSLDVQVDMSPVCSVVHNPGNVCIAPGHICHADDPRSSALMSAFALLKQKEVLAELNRRLLEAVGKENLDYDPGCSSSSSSGISNSSSSSSSSSGSKLNALDIIERLVASFKYSSSSIRKYSYLLQLSLALTQSIKSKKLKRCSRLQMHEKSILQCFDGDDDDDEDGGSGGGSGRCGSVLMKVVDQYCKDCEDDNDDDGGDDGGCGSWKVDGLLSLLLFAYSCDARGRLSLSSKQETQLEVKLTRFIMRFRSRRSIAGRLFMRCRSEAECLSVVQDILDKMKSLSSVKSHLKKYVSTIDPGSFSTPPSHQPIVKQIMQDILDPNLHDLPDLTFHPLTSHGGGGGMVGEDLIKSGFGFFRGQSKPRPLDSPLVIIFIIGGVTVSEFKVVKEVMSRSKVKNQVLVGGTNLVNPDDVLRMTLAQDNLLIDQ